MKILKVVLKNLASYDGEYTIDFTEEPLKHAGLYSIVGPTGSGKSTILDAICLALYGTAPKFKGATELKYFDNKDAHYNEKDKVLLPDDSRNILRKGAKEGLAEVEFIANDNEHYKARWYAKRNPKRYAPRERTLLRYSRTKDGLETEEVLYKGGKDSPLFQQVIGLDYEQFTRTIMLAQNSFANFIKCKSPEKAKLLERLTGTEIYTQIATRVNIHYKEAMTNYNNFLIRMEADKRDLLPEQERLECQTALEETQKKSQEAESEIRNIEKQIDWLNQLNELKETYKKAEDILATKRNEWKEHAGDEKNLNLYNSLTPVIGKYESLKVSEKKSDNLKQQISSIENVLLKVRQELLAARKETNEAKTQAEKTQQDYDQLQQPLKEARNLQSILTVKQENIRKLKSRKEDLKLKLNKIEQELTGNLQKQTEVQSTLTKAEQTLQALKPFESAIQKADILQKLFEELQKEEETLNTATLGAKKLQSELTLLSGKESSLQQQRTKLQEQTDKLSQRLQQLEKSLKKKDGAALRKMTEQAGENAILFEKAVRFWKDFFGSQRNIYKYRSDIEQRERTIRELKTREQQLTEQYQNIERQLPGIQTAYQMLVSENVERMRDVLKDNEPCPVCGALHHPYAETHTASLAAEMLRKKQEQFQKDKDKTYEQLKQNQERLSIENGTLTKLKESLQTEMELLPEKEANWKTMLSLDSSLSTVIAVEDRDAGNQRYLYLKQRQEEEIRKREACKKEEETYFKLDEDYKKLQKEKEELTEIYQKSEKECAAIELEKARKQQERNNTEQRIKESKQAIEQITGELDNDGLEENWYSLWQEDRGAYAGKWKARAVEWNNATLQKDNSSSESKTLKATGNALKSQKEDALQNYNQAEKDYTNGLAEQQTLTSQLNGFWNGRLPDEVEKAAKEKLEHCNERYQTALTNVNTITIKVENTSVSLKEKQQQLDNEQTAKAKIETDIREWLTSEGCNGISFEELDWFLAPERNWEQVRMVLSHKKEELKELEGQVKIHQENLAKLEQSSCKSDQTADTLKEHLQQQQKTIEDLEKTQKKWVVKLENDAKSRHLLQQSEKERIALEKEYNNWNELNKLMGAYKGDDIRQAAQCYTLQFLVFQANKQLKMLTSRYRLVQVPDSLSLRIKDMDYAGEERNISSLSGGETFLVSLALALGLSAISSANHNYGMLFIDEGFGTLDDEALNIVIDALSTLQSIQGKKVCVISHTSEMRERIPVQIQVIKGNTEGKSSLRIVGQTL